MKYGDTLQQRSIPLWENYNVDYNDIKHLIKLRTTREHTQATPIPAGNNETKAVQAFEDELYHELHNQHQRIDLFVQSKTGEIARRLAHLDKQIAHLAVRSFPTGRGNIPIKRLERYSRLEEAALKAGEEIQSLSRFVGAQRLAFQKLLKKYRKWTGSSELGNRFRKEILDRRTSFSKTDFEPLLAQWTEVLASVRAPFINGMNQQPDSAKSQHEEPHAQGQAPFRSPGESIPNQGPTGQGAITDLSSTALLQTVWEDGSNIEIDTALATTPFGHGAARAAYWIHPDDVVQIHVLLLQYTRLQKLSETISSPESPSSSRGSFNVHPPKSTSRTDEEVGIIICDDLERFAQKQSSETINDTENRAGLASERAAASIRYSPNGDAVVAVDAAAQDVDQSGSSSRKPRTRKAKIKRKAIQRLFSASENDQGAVVADDSKDADLVCEWFARHKEVQPLVHLRLRRTRFLGLKNSATKGLWATLDKDISMRSCHKDLYGGNKGFDVINDGWEDFETFPHAILEIRTEGPIDTDLIAALDASHLTERVRGFSLGTHAVAALCKPRGMPRPFWLPALKQDIRKVPATPTASKPWKSQGRSLPDESSTRHTSISASSTRNGLSSSGFSALRGESSATSAPETLTTGPLEASKKKKRRRSNRKQLLQKRLKGPAQPRYGRYWNEFDDGSEGSQDEAYAIYVDPNAPPGIPGAAAVSRLFGSLSSGIKATEEKTLRWLRSSQKARHGEQKRLVNGECYSPSTADSDQSDVDSTNRPVKSSAAHRHYSTFGAHPQPPTVQARARERLLLRFCIASFASSFVLLIVATILFTTGRRKAAFTVDVGVIIGVVSSLMFAITGVGSMVARRDDVGWVHRAVVVLIFLCDVLASAILLAALRHEF